MDNKKGFTLTELMIVVSIIAFLGILVTGYLRTQFLKGNDARRKADINRIGIAVEEYEKDKNCYPTSVTCTASDSLQPYLNEIPCDPVLKTPYYYQHDGTSCPKWYILFADLDNEKDVDYLPGIGPSAIYSYYQSSPNAPEVTSGGSVVDEFYGCKSGVCTPVASNPDGEGAICDVSFGQSNCLGTCGTPSFPLNECMLK